MRIKPSVFAHALKCVVVPLLGVSLSLPHPVAGEEFEPGSDAVRQWVADWTELEGSQKDEWLSDMLEKLPEPEHWADLRRALKEAKDAAPPDATSLERRRFQSGGWLLAYLLGDRDSVLTEVRAVTVDDRDAVEGVHLQRLEWSLSNPDGDAEGTRSRLEVFEEQIAMFEPVDLEEVKAVIGGEENFAILHRLLEARRVFVEKVIKVYEEFEQTKDSEAADSKIKALVEEFENTHRVEQEAIVQTIESPVIQRYLMSLQNEPEEQGPYSPSIHVPDLVTLAGPERAAELINKALRLPLTLVVEPETGPQTLALLKKLAIAGIDEMKQAQWGLVNDLESVALYEALLRKFSQGDETDYFFQRARVQYLFGLVAEGRVDEALALALSGGTLQDGYLSYSALDAVEQSGHADDLWKFLHGWMTARPESGDWSRFNRLSVQLGRQEELKNLVATLAGDGSLAGMSRQQVQLLQADAEMAMDELEKAASRFQAMLVPIGSGPTELAGQMTVVTRLLWLSELQGDRAGFDAARAAGVAILEHLRQHSPEEALDSGADFVSALNSLGRHTEAYQEGQLMMALLSALHEKRAGADKATEDGDAQALSDYTVRNLLGEQLRAAVELGLWDAAWALVDENPWWGARDLRDLASERVTSNSRPVGYYMALVVLQRGDRDSARRILEAQLKSTPGVDAVYEAYLGLVNQEARPFLAKLAAVDRYEERPLIWLGRLQGDAGEWDASIETLQQAINIDPSDGEQGPGDRMRVYANMERAMDAKGDGEKAAFFNNVVKSIRLSETADRWYEIGAFARAIRIYREALGFFADAYCIQSRLAVRLAKEGRMDEAAEHYRRAFELMPDSFGRVESHCFGCEHVFESGESQDIAGRVFTQMLEARPDKPQLHYLLGYLREEQKRHTEAAGHYRRAVALDPLYLNAWEKLGGLQGKVEMSAGEIDDLMLKMLELDPAGRHSYPSLGSVGDLRRLWSALKERDRVLAEIPDFGEVLRLTASAAWLDRNPPDGMESLFGRRGESDFASVIRGHQFVNALQYYVSDAGADMNGEDGESGL
ncbi:MAG TPA: tetratricopeptide repeat protein [Opitutaceae bacterium]|nr:tetratricopeptide repeat protein [Opitutaceae bacterium]